MPQLILTISQNINANLINFKDLFKQIHDTLQAAPDMDVNNAHAGVMQELFSYIGFANPKATKVYLQLYWLETKARAAMKVTLGKSLVNILENTIVPEVKQQGFICVPRVRIANLGELNQDYFIGADDGV